MRSKLIFFALVFIPLITSAQFEQKISVTLSGGMFATLGPNTWMPDWGSVEEEREPLQIANYKPGVSATAGIQYNLNRHFSIQAELGLLSSSKWFYDDYDGHNYYEWAIWDPITDDLLAEGENELTMRNIGIGFTPKYYLMPGKKINPFLFTGVSVNFTSTTYEDNEWQAWQDLDMMDQFDPDGDGPDRAFIEENTGLGLNPGVGVEISINDNIGFHVLGGYYLVLLGEDSFYVPEQHENIHAIIVQAGLKFSFLKSKDL